MSTQICRSHSQTFAGAERRTQQPTLSSPMSVRRAPKPQPHQTKIYAIVAVVVPRLRSAPYIHRLYEWSSGKWIETNCLYAVRTSTSTAYAHTQQMNRATKKPGNSRNLNAPDWQSAQSHTVVVADVPDVAACATFGNYATPSPPPPGFECRSKVCRRARAVPSFVRSFEAARC